MNILKAALIAIAFFLVITPDTHAQGLQNITCYIQNPTSRPISFLIRKGTDPWSKFTLKSGHTYTMTGIAPHTVKYNNGEEDKTFNCRHGKTYYFSWVGGALQFYVRK
jgi:hypothetical protein